MSYYIDDNNFAQDTYPKRVTRLHFLANSISKYTAELAISGDMLSWALNAFSEFNIAIGNESVSSGEKNAAFQTFQEALDLMTKRYQILKDLLISRYAGDESKLLVYGILGKTQRTIAGIIQLSEMLTVANARLKDSGDLNVLPDGMISEFQLLIDDTKEKYFLAGMNRENSTKASKELKSLFDSDTKKIKAIYSWIVAYWGKYDSRLISLGFVESKVKKGTRGPDAPINLMFEHETGKVKWDEAENATSYQMSQSDADRPKPRWQKAYTGNEKETILVTKFQNLIVKVRARSANGYGKWSEEVRIVRN